MPPTHRKANSRELFKLRHKLGPEKIVHRVNIHDELVEAVKQYANDIKTFSNGTSSPYIDDLINRASQGGSKP